MQDEKSPCGCTDEPACGPDCVAIERNRYFTGKYMTARDFQVDPDYFLSRHRLQNRLTLGWGIVCGLEVDKLEKGDCGKRWVVIKPGIAIDCYGREIVVKHKLHFELERLDSLKRSDTNEPWPHFLLCIQYGEKDVETVPALYADNTCDPKQEEYNRVRECPKIDLCPLDEFDPDCWHASPDEWPTECGPKTEEDESAYHDPCFPGCPCGTWVPLALIKPTGEGDQPEGFDIETKGAPRTRIPGKYLTRIDKISWDHGATISFDELRQDVPAGALEECSETSFPLCIHFTRPLKTPEADEDDGLMKIDPEMIRVSFKGTGDKPENVVGPLNRVYFLDPCTVVYEIPGHLCCNPPGVKDKQPELHDMIVTIAVRGDFFEDLMDNPPDVDFLRASLPTGSGVAGGTFTSWFRYQAPPHEDTSKTPEK